MGGEAKNEGYFCNIPIIKRDTNFISQNLLVRQTSNHHHCDWHAQKTDMQWLSSDFEQFFLVKKSVYF